MGFELDRLMRERGVATPGMVAYSGQARPADLAADATAEQRAAFAEAMRKYNLGQEAYNQYRQEYERRVMGTPQYLNPQFNTSTGANVPPVMTFSPAQMAALKPGSPNALASNSLDRMNRDIRTYFAQNPSASAADVFKFREQYGLSEQDIRNAMGQGFQFGSGPSGFGSLGARTAAAPGGIGMDQYNTNIRNYFANNPTAAQVAAEQAKYGVTNRDIYNATGSYFGNVLRAPTYDFAPVVDPNARSTIPTTPDRRTTLNTTNTNTTTTTNNTDTSAVDRLRGVFDQSIFGKTPEEKAAYYNSLLNAGYDDATIRTAINAPLDANWTALQNLARQQSSSANLNNTTTTLPDLTSVTNPDFNVGGNPRVGTFDSVQLMSHGGGVHDMAQKYNIGGAVKRFRMGGVYEDDEQGGAESYPVAPQPEMRMRPLDKYDDLPDSVGNTPMGMPPAAPATRSVAAPAPAPAPVTESPAARPITPRPSPSTPMSPAANDLAAMLQRYTGGESPYAADLAAARTKVDTESKAFENLLKTAMKPGSTAPDKTELYFRLAAAFGAPTRTGSFGETLSGVGKELSEFAKETRASKKAEQQLGLQLGLEAQKMRLQGAREELGALRALAGEEMKDKRALLLEYLKSGRPQSEAGKAAIDAGLTQGTPEFNNFVKKYIEEKISSGNAIKEAMVLIAQGNLNVAQAGLNIRQSAEERAREAAKKLTPGELKLKTETEDRLTTIDSAMADLGRAYDLNKNSFDTTLKDTVTRKAMEETGSKDPRVVATRELENLLKSAMISSASQKLTGVLSDSDIKLLLSIAGLDAKSKTEREQILKNAYRSLRTARQAQQKRLNEISQGLYRETSPAPAGPGED